MYWSKDLYLKVSAPLRWRHNERAGVSNHQPHDYLLNRVFRRRSKKISKLRVTGRGIHRVPVNSPHKWPVTRKMYPFDDVIMLKVSAHSNSWATRIMWESFQRCNAYHGDVMAWKRFLHYWPFVKEIHQSIVHLVYIAHYVVFYCGFAALLVLVGWCESFTHTLQGYFNRHYSDVIMSAMASHFSEASIVLSTVCSGTDQRKNITRLPVSALCKGIYWTGDQWIPRTHGQ